MYLAAWRFDGNVPERDWPRVHDIVLAAAAEYGFTVGRAFWSGCVSTGFGTPEGRGPRVAVGHDARAWHLDGQPCHADLLLQSASTLSLDPDRSAITSFLSISLN